MINKVPGIILKFNDNEVIVQITLNNENLNINLNKDIFPIEIKYGMPIYLEVDSFGKPIISLRSIIPNQNIINEFDTILNSL